MSADNPNRAMAEAFVNLVTNGAMERIDQRGQRARELYQWGLHPHHTEPGSPLAADNAQVRSLPFQPPLSGLVRSL